MSFRGTSDDVADAIINRPRSMIAAEWEFYQGPVALMALAHGLKVQSR